MLGGCKDNLMIPASRRAPEEISINIYMEGEPHQFVAIGPKVISYFADRKIHVVEDNLMDV